MGSVARRHKFITHSPAITHRFVQPLSHCHTRPPGYRSASGKGGLRRRVFSSVGVLAEYFYRTSTQGSPPLSDYSPPPRNDCI
ncbi:hypothetical protein BD779DRAFT_1571411, partial [Infundibulicybe gibba]